MGTWMWRVAELILSPAYRKRYLKTKQNKQTSPLQQTNKPTKMIKPPQHQTNKQLNPRWGKKKTRKKEMKIKGRVDAGDDPVWTAVLPRSSLPAQILVPVHMLRWLS